jgi:hypothetical protein
MVRCKTAGVILVLSVGLCACANKQAAEPSGTQLASQAKEIDCDKVIDYKMTQREPRDFAVGYQAEMIVGEFARDDTFNVKYQGRLYLPKAARGLVHINAHYQSTVYWCEGNNIGGTVGLEAR